MCGEDGGYLRQAVAQVEHAHAAHPLVGVIDDAVGREAEVRIEVLDDFRRCVREHARLVVVAVGVQGINAELLPHLAVDAVFLGEEGLEIDEHGDGIAVDEPSAHPYLQSFGTGFLLPILEKRAVRLKIW